MVIYLMEAGKTAPVAWLFPGFIAGPLPTFLFCIHAISMALVEIRMYFDRKLVIAFYLGPPPTRINEVCCREVAERYLDFLQCIMKIKRKIQKYPRQRVRVVSSLWAEFRLIRFLEGPQDFEFIIVSGYLCVVEVGQW